MMGGRDQAKPGATHAIRLDGRSFLVTGAGQGIGRAIAQRLKQAGGRVAVGDIALPADAFDYSDLALQLDVTSDDDWAMAEQSIRREFGVLSGLVNNAGIAFTDSFERTPLATWRRVQSVNVEGAVLATQHMLALLRAGGEGLSGGATIVNLSSAAALRGAAFNVAYSAAKGALSAMSRSLAVEFATLGYPVRVNAVHPGAIDTRMIEQIHDRYVELGIADTRMHAAAAADARRPSGRMSTPDEVAEVVAFLCSAQSRFTTGAQMVIDGGVTLI